MNYAMKGRGRDRHPTESKGHAGIPSRRGPLLRKTRAYGMLGFPFFSVTPIGQHSAEP